MQKYLKNNKGFTLVEVIVVAVIVLVLAAVAIPLYNGYINDSRLSSVENAAGAIASAFGAAVQTDGKIVTISPVEGGDQIEVEGTSGGMNYILVPSGMTATWDAVEVTVKHDKKCGQESAENCTVTVKYAAGSASESL